MVLLLALGCKKKPGEGGKAEIKGRIIADYYCDDTGELLETAPIAGQRIYISYGESSNFDDDTRTSSTGEYAFKFMYPGEYTITVLSECGACPAGTESKIRNVSVGKRDRDVDVGTIKISDYSGRACPDNPYRGFAEVRGKLVGIFIDENNGDTLSVEPFQDERIYIAFKGEMAAFDNVRAGADGSFLFTRIPTGEFEVFAYSECPVCPSRVKPEFLRFSIVKVAEKLNIGELRIIEYRGR